VHEVQEKKLEKFELLHLVRETLGQSAHTRGARSKQAEPGERRGMAAYADLSYDQMEQLGGRSNVRMRGQVVRLPCQPARASSRAAPRRPRRPRTLLLSARTPLARPACRRNCARRRVVACRDACARTAPATVVRPRSRAAPPAPKPDPSTCAGRGKLPRRCHGQRNPRTGHCIPQPRRHPPVRLLHREFTWGRQRATARRKLNAGGHS